MANQVLTEKEIIEKKFVASKEVTVNSSSFKEALIFLFASWF